MWRTQEARKMGIPSRCALPSPGLSIPTLKTPPDRSIPCPITPHPAPPNILATTLPAPAWHLEAVAMCVEPSAICAACPKLDGSGEPFMVQQQSWQWARICTVISGPHHIAWSKNVEIVQWRQAGWTYVVHCTDQLKKAPLLIWLFPAQGDICRLGSICLIAAASQVFQWQEEAKVSRGKSHLICCLLFRTWRKVRI